VRSRGDQLDDRSLGITAGHQTLTDEHRVGTCAGVRQQIGGATHPGLGDPQHVTRQPRCDLAEDMRIDFQGVQVAGVDPDQRRAGF
jgi:hypothetical protein